MALSGDSTSLGRSPLIPREEVAVSVTPGQPPRTVKALLLIIVVLIIVIAIFNLNLLNNPKIIPYTGQSLKTSKEADEKFLCRLEAEEDRLLITSPSMRLSRRLHRHLHLNRTKERPKKNHTSGVVEEEEDEEEEGGEAFDDLANWQISPEILKWLRQQNSVPLATLPFASNQNYSRHREKRCPNSAVMKSNSTFFRQRFNPSIAPFISSEELLTQHVFDRLLVYKLPWGTAKTSGSSVKKDISTDFQNLARHPYFNKKQFMWDVMSLKSSLTKKAKPSTKISSSSTKSASSSPSTSGCLSCAVVGGGGGLLGGHHGAAIDSHDLVFRVNVALIKGFEKDVGTKFNFYVSYPESFQKFVRNPNAFPDAAEDRRKLQYIFSIYEVYHPSTYKELLNGKYAKLPGIKKHLRKDKGFFEPSQVWFIHPDFHRHQMVKFLPTVQKKATTGFTLVMLSLHLCDSVSMYGFSYKNAKQTHYYEKGALGLPKKHHDVDDEYKIFKKLHDDGVINWVQ